MGGISARVSKAAQSSAMITPFWKTYKAEHPASDGPDSSNSGSLKTRGETCQQNITETLRSVFIPPENLHENLTGLKLQYFHGLTMLLFPLKSDVQTK